MSSALGIPSQESNKESKILPGFLVLLFFVEMWERYSFYGMAAILIHFLTNALNFTDQNAYAVFSLFSAIALAGPVLGGIIADRLMGFRNMVFAGSIVISLGHIAIAIFINNNEGIFFGLSLVAVGIGLFKGNITNLLGSCYAEEDETRERGFTLFYVGINLGSVLATITCGYIAEKFGWHYGFGIAGIGMIFGLITLIIFGTVIKGKGLSPRPDIVEKKYFGIKPIWLMVVAAIFLAYFVSILLLQAETIIDYAAYITQSLLAISFLYIIFSAENAQQRTNLFALIILLIFLLLFFAIEIHLHSLFNLVAARNVDLNIFGHNVPPSISQTINPATVIGFGVIFSILTKFNGMNAMFNFALGILGMSACGFLIYIGCVNADIKSLMQPIYFVSAVICIGLAEVLIVPYVLSQATLLAPQKLKGFIMGTVMLSISCAVYVGGKMITKFMSIPSVSGKVDNFVSLTIYKEGFFYIGIFYLVLTFIFIIISYIFLKKVISRAHGAS